MAHKTVRKNTVWAATQIKVSLSMSKGWPNLGVRICSDSFEWQKVVLVLPHSSPLSKPLSSLIEVLDLKLLLRNLAGLGGQCHLFQTRLAY